MQQVNLGNKVYTENPLLDEIVYNIRQIISNGVTIKDAEKANQFEGMETLMNGDLLIAINSGTIHFTNFTYDIETLSKYYSDPLLIIKYAGDNSLIPVEDRPALLQIAVDTFSSKYVEYNNYYRMLHGEPYYDPTGKYQGLWIDIRQIDITTPTSLDYIYYSKPVVDESEEQYYQLIHKLDISSKNMLYDNRTCENITNADTTLATWGITKEEVLYLLHIGDREVDYYHARVADRFALLYCPVCDSEEVMVRFQDLFEANRLYFLYTVYSDAYKLRSYYYTNFVSIFILLQTVIDMVVELPEYIIRRDIFDTRTCKYIFESNGVKYFSDIPLKYQVSLVKNLNKLIKFKSTDKCIVDIISIFGIDNIDIFKYYILKDRQVKDPLKLNYYSNKKEVTDSLGETTIVDDNQANYDLKFIKVPMFGSYDDCIRTESNIYDYDAMTDGDPYWRGDRDYANVKEDIKELDFTVLRSKYYSIEAVIDLAKRNFIVVYFTNILMYNKVDSSALQVRIPSISSSKFFEIIDVIITLFSISYIYYGVEDTILDSRAKAAQILGFNMEADLAKISAWLEENHRGLTLKDLHVDTFQSRPEGSILTFKELENIFFTNKDCYDHVISVMTNPPSKDIYNAYRYIYKAMMTTNRNMEYFLIGNNETVDYYKGLGYTSKFINIPQMEKYTNPDDYYRDYKWMMDSIDLNHLCFEMSSSFDEDHKFDLYIKEEGQSRLTKVGTAQMAYTYKDYLAQKDGTLYAYIKKILAITKTELRQEACITAIQTIVSALKDYIDDSIPLDTVFSGLPSISMDFIRQYITEVIDFFKSFKIFTYSSSIIYIIDSKFDNYVQLIEQMLLHYLFEKHELFKIEDAIHQPMTTISGKIVPTGFGIHTRLNCNEINTLIDKVWLDISTWIYKQYPEYYNSEQYTQTQQRIMDYQERFSTFELNDFVFEESISDDQDKVIDCIVKLLVTVLYSDDVVLLDKIVNQRYTHEFNELPWIHDLGILLITRLMTDTIPYQDDMIRTNNQTLSTYDHIFDGTIYKHIQSTNLDKINIADDVSMIETKSYI